MIRIISQTTSKRSNHTAVISYYKQKRLCNQIKCQGSRSLSTLTSSASSVDDSSYIVER